MISDQFLKDNFFDALWYNIDQNASENDIKEKFDVIGQQIIAKGNDAVPLIETLKSIDEQEFKDWQEFKFKKRLFLTKYKLLFEVIKNVFPLGVEPPNGKSWDEETILRWMISKS